MTVTPLSSRDQTFPVSPRSRRTVARRRRVTTEPAGLTVTFEVTLAGESRYADALEILDTLRQVTDRLGTATLQVAPTAEAGVAPSAFLSSPGLRAVSPAAQGSSADVIQILADSRSVLMADEQISLTRVEFDLLTFLAEHPRRVFGRSQLLKNVWGYEHTGPRTVDVHVRRLRAKLGDRLVTTIRGIGYRLADEANVRVVRLR
jgi:DNA-binding response OmpR family regulator